jgi:hypothetical protein
MRCMPPLAVDPRSAERSGGTRPVSACPGTSIAAAVQVERDAPAGESRRRSGRSDHRPGAGPSPARFTRCRKTGDPTRGVGQQCIAQPHGAERWPASAIPARSRRASAWRRERVGFAHAGRRRSGRSDHRPRTGPAIRHVALVRQCIAQPPRAERWPASAVPARSRRASIWRRERVGFAHAGRRRSGRSDHRPGAGSNSAVQDNRRSGRRRWTGTVDCATPWSGTMASQRCTRQTPPGVCLAPRTCRLRTRCRPFLAVSTRRAGSAAA